MAMFFKRKEKNPIRIADKKVKDWKTGFYYIAIKANVPVIMFTMDFEHKTNNISEPYYLTGNFEKDMSYMKSFFKGVKGKIEAYS